MTFKNKGKRNRPTASGTRPGLCIRADLAAWKKSTTPSVLSLSSWEWMQMKVPVLPTPSLLEGGREGGREGGKGITDEPSS